MLFSTTLLRAEEFISTKEACHQSHFKNLFAFHDKCRITLSEVMLAAEVRREWLYPPVLSPVFTLASSIWLWDHWPFILFKLPIKLQVLILPGTHGCMLGPGFAKDCMGEGGGQLPLGQHSLAGIFLCFKSSSSARV